MGSNSSNSVPPFPDVRSPRVGPIPRRPFPWWLIPVTFGLLGLLMLAWRMSEPAATIVWPTGQAQVQAINVNFDPVNTVIAQLAQSPIPLATDSPTATHTPVVTDAERYGYCTPSMPMGTLCMPYPQPTQTPLPVATCYADSTSLCRIPGDPEITGGNADTK
jgi:hypothetical protein